MSIFVSNLLVTLVIQRVRERESSSVTFRDHDLLQEKVYYFGGCNAHSNQEKSSRSNKLQPFGHCQAFHTRSQKDSDNFCHSIRGQNKLH